MKKTVSICVIIAIIFTSVPVVFAGAATNPVYVTEGDFKINTSVDFVPGDEPEAQLVGYAGQERVVEIPEYVGAYQITSISYDFSQLNNQNPAIEQIYIPKTVVDVDATQQDPFSNLPACSAIVADEENAVFASESGVLYTKDFTRLIRVPRAYAGEAFEVKTGVQTIGRGALASCRFTTINFPETLLSVEQNFIADCPVEELYLPDSLKSISALAFYETEKLGYVYFGAGVQVSTGFIQYDEKQAFSRHGKIREFAVSGDNPYLSVQDGVLFNKDKTELISYPKGKSAKTYVVPDSVKVLLKNAFCGTSLTSLNTNQVESICKGSLFASRIQHIILGEALKSVNLTGFFGQYNQSWTFLSKDCQIESGTYSTKKRTIYGYYDSTVYQYYTTHYWKDCMDFVFLEEPELGYRYTELTNDTIRIDSYKGYDAALEIPAYIDGKKVVWIGADAFAGNTSITALILPQTLETIDSHAFDALTQVTELTIPASVQKISSYALSGMSALTKVYINSFSCTIDDSALPQTKVFACSGSTAESYAGRNALSFFSVGHQFVSEEIENNKIRKTCSLCGYTEVVDNPIIHHDYVAQVIEPSCTEQGYTVYTCSICGDSYITDYKAALGHEPFEIKATSPTCKVEGKTAGSQCARCQLILKAQEPIAKLAHEYDGGNITLEPTCIQEGIKTFHCRNCDDFYTEPVAKTAHSYIATVKQPTCLEQGYTTYTCSGCGDSYTAQPTPLAEHTPQEIPAVAATCTREGSTKGSKCAVCALVLEAPRKTEKLPHAYDSGTLTLAPTCIKEGSKVYRCQNCDAVYTERVGKIPHDYMADVKEPTCTEQGHTTYTCAYCRDTYRGDITDLLPHTPQDIPAVAATCTKEGSTKGSRCAVCAAVLEAPQSIAKLAHEYDSGKTTQAPTCKKEGVKTFTCKHCPAYYTQKLAKVGHNYAVVVKKAASFSQNGVLNEECSMCKQLRKSTVVKSLKTAKLSATVLTYTGKNLTAPKVTVTDSAGKTVAAKYYTITIISRANSKAVKSFSAIGQYKVKITFKNGYSGTKYLYFTVKPRTIKQYTPTTTKKAITAKWKKDTAATGYQVVIATNKSFSAGKKVYTLKNTLTNKKITGLKSGKVYYVRIRAYKKIVVDGKKLNIYSSYSAVKKIKCK
ncbi:MAG: leucine-rich repeat protein [Clostridia bacterium]|nr:leucine-rich repeat protein [Clostridia bacterium]